MKTDSGSLRRLNSWFHPFWKTKYGPERFLLNCCSVYTDWLFVTPWISACQAPLSFTISQSLFKFTSIEAMMSSNHVILCHPLLLRPSVFPRISPFQWVSSSYQVAKGLELQLQQHFFQWIFKLISFRIDWFDLTAVQGTLKHHKNGKHQFFGTQPSLWTNSHIHTWLLEKPQPWLYGQSILINAGGND